MNRTVLLAVIFPANLPYFPAFLKSVREQTGNQFDVLIGNDGVTSGLFFGDLKNISVVDVTGSPLQTRVALLDEASRRGYTKFIFADTDDELGPDRIHIVSQLLSRADCVCNDVDLIDSSSNSLVTRYWEKRLGDEYEINSNFLRDKNIIGFGNTGLTQKAVTSMRGIDVAHAPAPDWLYFSLLVRENRACFTSACTTRYRQHTDNIIGIKAVTPERLNMIVRVKAEHYRLMSAKGIDFREDMLKMDELKAQIADPIGMRRAIDALKTLNINYFWWEETNYL